MGYIAYGNGARYSAVARTGNREAGQMGQTEAVRSRLAALMNERRVELGLRWTDVAEAGDVSAETLRAIRRTAAPLRDLTKAGIERGLRWPRGSVDRILRGEGAPEMAALPPEGDPVPQCVYEAEILATDDITGAAKRQIVRVHRQKGHASWCQPDAATEPASAGRLRA